MSDDAMTLFQAMRPPTPQMGGDIRMPATGRSRELHDLAMVPGSPAYRARIPPPPCWQCGEDHVPGQAYDHQWMAEPPQVHDEPVAASAVLRRPTPSVVVEAAAEARAMMRVAIYVARGDAYAVSIETAPEWDSVETYRVNPSELLLLVKLARALGVKVQDKTGGDLLMLEQEMADASQHAQAHGGNPAPAGGAGPRRPGLDADWQKAYRQSGREPPDPELPGPGSERPDPA